MTTPGFQSWLWGLKHYQSITKISLGFKNLKGCLSQDFGKTCHNIDHSVDEYWVYLGAKLYPPWVVVDGLYALERGPTYIGQAHRPNLLRVGPDIFSVDCIGASLMGFRPSEVGHLRGFAELYSRSLDAKEIEVKGLKPFEHTLHWEYKTPRTLPILRVFQCTAWEVSCARLLRPLHRSFGPSVMERMGDGEGDHVLHGSPV